MSKTDSKKTYTSAIINKLDNSQVEIKAVIENSIWSKYRQTALKNINESLSMDGFRKGMIPENILIAKVGEMAILEEVAELAISNSYVDIISDNNVEAIGRPEIKVTKLATNNPIEFTATTSIIPKIELPDYKKIAIKETSKSNTEAETVTEKDLDEAILRIRKSRVSHEGHDHDKLTPEEHEKEILENLPDLNDEFVKSLGEFKDVADFKDKVSKIVAEEKKNSAKEKMRIKIADAISDESKISLPEIIIESELDRTEAQFRNDIERMGVKLEDYVKHANKTLVDIRTEWRPHAEKKAKLQLILNEIAKKESLSPSEAEIENEVKHIVEHYKDADRERAAVYAETVLKNEKVFQFLENLK